MFFAGLRNLWNSIYWKAFTRLDSAQIYFMKWWYGRQGKSTIAKPRPGKPPDPEFQAAVRKIIYGSTNPFRKMTGVKVVIMYEDGDDTVYEYGSGARVYVGENRIEVQPFMPDLN